MLPYVSLDIKLSSHVKSPPRWRFSSLRLSDNNFCTFISISIDSFLEFNENDSTSHSSLWETLKANLRGHAISFTAKANKVHKAKMSEFMSKIILLDQHYSSDPSPELFKQWLDFQTEFDLISTRDAELLLLKSRSTYYEHKDKVECLLARQLKWCAASQMVPQIKDSTRLFFSFLQNKHLNHFIYPSTSLNPS